MNFPEELRQDVYLLRVAGYPREEVKDRLDFEGPDWLLEDVLDDLYQDTV